MANNEKRAYSSEPSLCSENDFRSFDTLCHVNACEKLNTPLIESNQDDDIAFRMRLMMTKTMGANSNVRSTQFGSGSSRAVSMISLLEDIWCFDNVARVVTLPDEQSAPLHAASARAQQHRVQSLLAAGADVNAEDSLGRTPLDVAGLALYEEPCIDVNSFTETVELLLKAGGKFLACCGQSGLDTPLHTAVELGSSIKAVEQILQGGVSATALNSLGVTAMHICVEKQNIELLQFLASHKSSNESLNPASMDVEDRNGRTVLCAAVEANWLQGVFIANSVKAINIKGAPLHTASVRAQQHRVQSLLAAGADVNAEDPLGRTPLDVAGLAFYKGYSIDVNSFTETVDLLLKAGGKFLACCGPSGLDTPLHTAVELGSSIAAVEQMLQGGATATALNSRGLTAMHICVEKRNEKLLQLLVSHNSSNEGLNSAFIDVKDRNGRTVLCAAVDAAWSEGVRIALSAGATNIKATFRNYSWETTVFHLAAMRGSTDVLEHLLDLYYYQSKIKNIINTFDALGPPIVYAVCFNNVDCVRLLIDKGAKVNILTKGNSERLLNSDAIEEIVTFNGNPVIIDINCLSTSPLYLACDNGNKKIIELLLKNGADLAGGENEKTRVPLKRLMGAVSKPTEFMRGIFDSNIAYLKKRDEDDVIVDFQVLLPRYGMKKMRVIQALLDTGNTYDQHSLLLHPLVESFLYLQWRSLLPFFYIVFALHVCFVLSLNVFAVSLFWYKDREIEPVPILFRSSAWIYVIYLTAFLLTIQEIIVIKKKTIRYLRSLEMLVKCLSTIFAVVMPQIISWDSISNPEWVRLFGSATLLLTWVRIMYQLSRLPDWGYYILMYGKVAIKVFKILASFGVLIYGFCVSFMIQFHAQPPFEDPLSSLLTTMVMMSSELGYNEIINKKTVDNASASHIMIRLIFVPFLIFVSIILMNLLVAVAVNDVNSLERTGNINRLKKQVQFIKSFEDTADNHFIKKVLPTCLYQRWFGDKTESKLIVTVNFPENMKYGLPPRLLEAIFEIAQSQKKQSNEKQGSKLDKIYEIIINKNSCVVAKPDIPDITMNHVLEEIVKLRTDMKQIKNQIGKISSCPRCSNDRKVLLKNSDGHSSCPAF